MRVSLKSSISSSQSPRKPTHQTFKTIDYREQIQIRPQPNFSSDYQVSPQVTKNLYNSGFVYKNYASPVACDFPLNSEFKRNPKSPFTPRSVSLVPNSPQAPSTASKAMRPRKCEDFTFKTDFVGKIGWGVSNQNPFLDKPRNVIQDKSFEWSCNDGGLRTNIQMETTGKHHEQVDTWLGLPCEQLDQLSVREQRKLVKHRVEQILSERAQLHLVNALPLTKPINTAQNTLMHRRQ